MRLRCASRLEMHCCAAQNDYSGRVYPSVTHEYWACPEPLPRFQITPKTVAIAVPQAGYTSKAGKTDRFRNRQPPVPRLWA
jgi:hypothetical protein